MDTKDAIRRVREIALAAHDGPDRTAMRIVARAAELGKRLSSTTLPAATSLVASVSMARALLVMAETTIDPAEVRRAMREARELLDRGLGAVERRIASAPAREEPPEDE